MSGPSQEGERIVACSGADSDNGSTFFGHPKIYVKIAEGETKPCPYCGKILGGE